MKGNNDTNKILYHDIAAQPLWNLPLVSVLEQGIPDCRHPWVFSERKLFLNSDQFTIVCANTCQFLNPKFKI
jgi:hypothetical protein